MEYRHKQGYWRAGPPKTQHGYHTIPLTNKAYDILLELYQNRKFRKESHTLSQSWNIWIGILVKNPLWLCETLFLSIEERENPQRTVLMTPTFTSYAMKQKSSAFVCTL